MNKPYGIDISHHQATSALPWYQIAETSSFCICRATYGTMHDRRTAWHVRRARSEGLQIGLYHFFRPSQSAREQLAQFISVAQRVGYRAGDIAPALDIEKDPIPKPGVEVSAAWQEGVRLMLDGLVEEFGEAMVYITQREFGMLGKPSWVLERPLWVAHYTGSAVPATPGNKSATLWQHRVAPYEGNGPGGFNKKRPELDQNRLLEPLPRATAVPWVGPNNIEVKVPDDGLDEACLEAMIESQQVDVVGVLRAEALRELSDDEGTK